MAPNYDEILTGRLWVGSFVRPQDLGGLSDIGITHLISLQSQSDLSSYSLQAEEVSAACRQAGIRFTHIPVRDFDRAALETSLDECVLGLDHAMARPGSRVYLHCTAGRNRAPTVAAAFLIRDRGMTAHAAFAHVTGCRDCQPYLSLLESYQVSIERSRGPAAGAGPRGWSPPAEDIVP